jgi:RNA polymerase sigma factor (sigma-70 family)
VYVCAYSAASRILGRDLNLVRDIALDAMLVLRNKYILTGRFDPSKGALTTLVHAIARRQAYRALERLQWERARRSEFDLARHPAREPQVPWPARSAAFEQAVRDAWAEAVKKLTATQRQVFTLRVEHDLSDEEIARRVGIKSGAVRARVHRARQRLRGDQALLRLAQQLLSPPGVDL